MNKNELAKLINEAVREVLSEQEQLTLPHVENSGPRKIVSYYETWTPDDVEFGDASDRGDYDVHEIELDEWDREEGVDVVDLAVEYLKDEGVEEASSSRFHPGIWYSTYGEADFRSGERENRSYHLKGFTKDEEQEIYESLKLNNVI